MNAYDDAGQVGKEAMDNAMKTFSVMTKGFQQVATETTDFTKRSYEESARMFEKLVQARSVEKVFEVQNEYAKAAYQSWIAQATKMGELYADIAKESYKPFEATVAKAANASVEFGRKASREVESAVHQAA